MCAQAQSVLKQVGLPNCYTMTKRMCEELLADLHCAAFPVAIVRPSIVGAIARAPVPGYFGNAAGVTSATLAFATGARSCDRMRRCMAWRTPHSAQPGGAVSRRLT